MGYHTFLLRWNYKFRRYEDDFIYENFGQRLSWGIMEDFYSLFVWEPISLKNDNISTREEGEHFGVCNFFGLEFGFWEIRH